MDRDILVHFAKETIKGHSELEFPSIFTRYTQGRKEDDSGKKKTLALLDGCTCTFKVFLHVKISQLSCAGFYKEK